MKVYSAVLLLAMVLMAVVFTESATVKKYAPYELDDQVKEDSGIQTAEAVDNTRVCKCKFVDLNNATIQKTHCQ